MVPRRCGTAFNSLREGQEARCSSFHVQGSRKLQHVHTSTMKETGKKNVLSTLGTDAEGLWPLAKGMR